MTRVIKMSCCNYTYYIYHNIAISLVVKKLESNANLPNNCLLKDGSSRDEKIGEKVWRKANKSKIKKPHSTKLKSKSFCKDNLIF